MFCRNLSTVFLFFFSNYRDTCCLFSMFFSVYYVFPLLILLVFLLFVLIHCRLSLSLIGCISDVEILF